MHMTCESYAKEEERIKKSLNKMIITIGKKELKYNTMISEESFFETTRNISTSTTRVNPFYILPSRINAKLRMILGMRI